MKKMFSEVPFREVGCMSYLDAVILGLIQGVTEFLPISSSGHLLLAQNYLSSQTPPLLFAVLLHLASLITVLFVFRSVVWLYLSNGFRYLGGRRDDPAKLSAKTFLILVAATALTAVIGLSFPEVENPKTVSLLFIVSGVLFLLPHLFKTKETFSLAQIDWKRGLLTGIAQGFAVLPGISRSGTTITAGLLLGMSRESVGEWAFLLFIPAVLGATILEIKDASLLLEQVSLGPLSVAFLVTLTSGFLSIKLLLWLVGKNRLSLFSLYLIPLGILGFFLF